MADFGEHLAFPQNKKVSRIILYYLILIIFLLLFIKIISSRAFQAFMDFTISFFPMVIITLMAIIAFVRSRKNPEDIQNIRKSALKNTLYLLLITLVFYILYSPASFSPILGSLGSIRKLVTMENFFLVFSRIGVAVTALTCAFLAIKYYQNKRGVLKTPFSQTFKRSLYTLFIFFFLTLSLSVSAYPGSYKPLTDALGDLIYTVSFGRVQVFKDDLQTYRQIKSARDLAKSLSGALSNTKENLTISISRTNQEFLSDLKDAKAELEDSIAQTNRDLKESLAKDINDKLDLSGATMTGSLTIESYLTVEDNIYSESVIPSEDISYDLGSPSKSWGHIYVRSLIGASPVTVGSASSSHSLSDNSDFIVSGAFEVNGVAYFDSQINLGGNKIVNLGYPDDSQDAATKAYVDDLVGAGAFFERAGSTITLTNAGDTLDLSGNLIIAGTMDSGMGATEIYLQNQNLRTADTPVFAGLTLAGNLDFGANTFTISNTNLIANLNADFLDGYHYSDFSGKLVTNGDSHNHSGGDGAQINHGALAGLSDDDHTQYHTDGRANTWLGTKSIADLGTKTHSLLSSLTADDHTQYALLAGRAGGQTLIGDTASGGNLTLQSTSHATKGKILFGTSAYDEANNRLGLGLVTPLKKIHFTGGGLTNPTASGALDVNSSFVFDDDDSILELVSNMGGTWGSALQLADINTTTGALNNKWSIIRKTSGQGNGLFVTYGTDPAGSSNTSFLNISSSGNILVNGFTSSTVGLTVKGAASQSADLQQWQNSAGSVLSVVDKNGNIGIGTSSPTSKLHVIGAATIQDYGTTELVTNGTFTSDLSNWSGFTGAYWYWNAGKATYTAGGGAGQLLKQTNYTYLEGITYRLSFDIIGWTAGSIQVRLGNVDTAVINHSEIGATSNFVFYLTPTVSTAELQFNPINDDFVGSVDNVSVRLAYGNSSFTNPNATINNLKIFGYPNSYSLYIGDGVNPLQGKGFGNTVIGSNALKGLTTGGDNTGLGANVYWFLTSGTFNTVVGADSMVALTQGNHNSAFGKYALPKVTTGSFNTSLGSYSGQEITTQNGAVFLGYQAGFYETAANTLMIDNQSRASEADARAKALLYGKFDATVANQFLTINGSAGIGTASFGTSAAKILAIAGSTAPSTSITDGIQLFAVDVAGSHELQVRDEAGNVTTLSPHNFSLIPEGPSEELAWSYYSHRGNKAISVDMAKSIRLLEVLTGQKLIHAVNTKEPNPIGPIVALQTLEDLALKTSKNISTLEDLQESVDIQLGVVEKQLSAIGTKILVQESEITDAKTQLAGYEEKIMALENLADTLQSQITELKNSIATPINIAQLDLNTHDIVYLKSLLGVTDTSKPGDISILGKFTASGIETGSLTIAASDEDAATIGDGTIKRGDKKITIETKAIKKESEIFVNLKNIITNQPLVVMDKKEDASFAVEVENPAENDIEFSWWIVNKKIDER